jgi:glycosyltransferase involved in cell wall biosynthesis
MRRGRAFSERIIIPSAHPKWILTTQHKKASGDKIEFSKHMTILIDLTQIPLSRTGVGVYADHLVSNLIPLLRTDDQLILVIQKDEIATRKAVEGFPNVHMVTIPSSVFRNRSLLLAFEQLILPILAWFKKTDVLHSLHYTHPLLALTPRVVTVHDLTFLLFPEMHTRGRRWIMPFFTRRAMRHAEAVIFVSNATQQDAERLLPAGSNLRSVVPLGVEPCVPILIGDGPSDSVLFDIGIKRPYLLFIGTLEPRKNIVRIVHAFEQIAAQRPALTLVLAGKLGWHTDEIVVAINNSPVQSRIRHLGFVSEVEKSVLLRNCEMLVYPSLYEGFGLPVLEAMAAGAPVITSNISSMPEVAGDAAVLVDPASTDAIASAVERILDDVTLASRLRVGGLAQASLFTWNVTARRTFQIYQDLEKHSM